MSEGVALVYLDPDFAGRGGHYSAMGCLMREEAMRAGVPMRHIVSRSVSAEQAEVHNLERMFSYGGNVDREAKQVEAIEDFMTQVTLLLKECLDEEKQSCVLFMYTAHPLHLPALAFLLNEYGNRFKRLQAWVCLFYINPGLHHKSASSWYMHMVGDAALLAERLDPAGRLQIGADSSRIADMYAPLWLRPITVLPLPIDQAPDVSGIADKGGDVKDITVGYVGHAVRRSGYFALYDLYRQLKSSDVFHKIRLVVKHTPHGRRPRLDTRFLRETERVRHITDFISGTEYASLMAQIDIILLPYRQAEFPVQSSGIFVEALSRGKIVIVPRNTWMADQLADFGAGETFESDNIDSLREAVENVVRNYAHYYQRRFRNREEFMARHCPKTLFEELGLAGRKEGSGQFQTVSEQDAGDFEYKYLKRLAQTWRFGQEAQGLASERDAMRKSLSWRVTAPLRGVKNWLDG